jgi:putative DNA methylase
MVTRKKLIEVALPLEAINAASAREKSTNRSSTHGHPSTLHLWWARRPLAAARAVIFAQMVDDPSANPDLFRTEKAQEKERDRLFEIIRELVQWENTTNEQVLSRAREEIWQSWRRACAQNVDHPRAAELFDRHMLPAFHDPFAGGGALPLEAQRLGLKAYASDLNPVAVLINKALIELPTRFAAKPPVNPDTRDEKSLIVREWRGAQGLAEDIRYYGRWILNEAEKRIGRLYPSIDITAAMVKKRPDLKPLLNQHLPVVAWLWARTVRSPNPAFANVSVPLASSFLLCTKAGQEAYVEPRIDDSSYRFEVKLGKPRNINESKNGTKLGRGANFKCLMSSTPITPEHISSEARAGRMGTRLMAIVADAPKGRVYLSPFDEAEEIAQSARPSWKPEGNVPARLTGGTCYGYGLTEWGDLFTQRQCLALTTFADLVADARELVMRDAIAAGLKNDDVRLSEGGVGAPGYADAVAVYLGQTASRITPYHCTLGIWRANEGKSGRAFGRQSIPMVWDFPECDPFSSFGGGWLGACEEAAKVVGGLGVGREGHAYQASAQEPSTSQRPPAPIISTDPPYYDNISYADLSDFFYVWLRRALRFVLPELFTTLAVPKTEELVAAAYRHGGKEKAEAFFLEGMTAAMRTLAESPHPAFPITIYYAFKQTEMNGDEGASSTGWDTFLAALIRAGFAITGTWPIRTEQAAALKATVNSLASSIVLVCRKRTETLTTATRREFVNALKAELPQALAKLQRGNIAPVDLAQAAIGPGMAVYTRYRSVLGAEGKPLSVREALALINQTLDEALSEQEGDFDADSRWALAWFEQHGFSEGEFGVADVLARAKNTSVRGMVDAGILKSSRGDVRLLKPSELPANWDPQTDTRLSAWESVHQLIRALESGGEAVAAELVAKLGSKAELARELSYRLYALCERKKRAAEALSYNALVQSFPELARLAKEPGRKAPRQATMLVEDEE